MSVLLLLPVTLQTPCLLITLLSFYLLIQEREKTCLKSVFVCLWGHTQSFLVRLRMRVCLYVYFAKGDDYLFTDATHKIPWPFTVGAGWERGKETDKQGERRWETDMLMSLLFLMPDFSNSAVFEASDLTLIIVICNLRQVLKGEGFILGHNFLSWC